MFGFHACEIETETDLIATFYLKVSESLPDSTVRAKLLPMEERLPGVAGK